MVPTSQRLLDSTWQKECDWGRSLKTKCVKSLQGWADSEKRVSLGIFIHFCQYHEKPDVILQNSNSWATALLFLDIVPWNS